MEDDGYIWQQVDLIVTEMYICIAKAVLQNDMYCGNHDYEN